MSDAAARLISDDDDVRIDDDSPTTMGDDRMMTTVLGLMMTMLSEGDEGRRSRIERFGSACSTGDRQGCSGFTRRESSSQPLITDYFRYWVPASCTSSNGFLSVLMR